MRARQSNSGLHQKRDHASFQTNSFAVIVVIRPQSDPAAGRTVNFWTEPAVQQLCVVFWLFLPSLFTSESFVGFFLNVISKPAYQISSGSTGIFSLDLCCSILDRFADSSADRTRADSDVNRYYNKIQCFAFGPDHMK